MKVGKATVSVCRLTKAWSSPSATVVSIRFTVRKISSGEGVERTFQTYSPLVAAIEVKRRGDVRRQAVLSPRAFRQVGADQGKAAEQVGQEGRCTAA